MATLNKQLFGNIKGTFGSAVFRQRKGNNYIAQRPTSYNPPNDEAYLMRIEKFRLSSKISSTIVANAELKSIWQNVIPKDQNVYNYLISKVYPFLDETGVKPSFSIVPSAGVGITIESAVWSDDKLVITLLPLTTSSKIDVNYEKTAMLHSVLILSSPLDESQQSYYVINISSNQVNIDLENPLSFESMLSTSIQNILSGYAKRTVFSSMFTYNEGRQFVNYSSTIYHSS